MVSQDLNKEEISSSASQQESTLQTSPNSFVYYSKIRLINLWLLPGSVNLGKTNSSC